MREIKFRAWDRVNKQMIPHNYLMVCVKNINKYSGKKQMFYIIEKSLK